MDEGDADKDTLEKALQLSEILDTIVKEINDNGR